MRLSTVLTRHHLFAPSLSARRLSSVRIHPAATAVQCTPIRARYAPVNKSLAYSATTFDRSKPVQLRNTSISAVQKSSMATGLPQSMLQDLQLLQQHYEQLPFAVNPSSTAADAANDLWGDLGGSAADAAGSGQPGASAAAVEQQLLTSAANTPAVGSKLKRRKLVGGSTASAQAAPVSDSTQGPPANLHDPVLSPEQLDFATGTISEPAVATAAVPAEAKTTLAIAPDSRAAIDASAQLVTPPPKPPCSRRGRKPAAAAAAEPAVVTLQQTTVTLSTSTLPVVAAVGPAVEPVEAAPSAPAAAPKKRGRRQPAAAPAAAADGALVPSDAAAAAAAVEEPATATPVKQTRVRKRKVAVVQDEVLIEQQLAASLPSADARTVDAVIAAAGVLTEGLEAAAGAAVRGKGRRSSSSSRGRGRGRRSTAAAEAADAVEGAQGGSNGTTGSAEAEAAPAAVDSCRPRRRGKKATAAAAAAADDADPTAAADTEEPPLVKSARRRSSQKTAAADSTSDDAEAAAAKPPKPVRRTKKVIAAEVLEAASQGQFGELTNLSSTYSHVALFNNNSNATAWQTLMDQAKQQSQQPGAALLALRAAADTADPQQQQQQQQGDGAALGSNGRSSSLNLCRTSGLGSFRQQVWIHSQSQSVFDAEAVATQDPLALLASQPPAAATAAAAAAAADGTADGIADGTASKGGTRSTAPDESELQVRLPAPQPLTPELQQQQLKVLPNLGYACLCMTLRKYEIFNSRDCVKKTRDAVDGLQKVSELALQNARDLVPMIHWNEVHGIRLFRLSSNIFPWMVSYKFEDLPDWIEIQKALRAAGDLAKRLGHRLTFHPSEYCKIAGERPDWVTQSVGELEVHSRIFDEMGFLPATPYNKINIHVGGTYGDKDAALERFSKVVNERLSPNCKARLTVENDDRASLYHVLDLMKVHKATGIPIVFDFHHWKFCTGDQTQEEAFRTALTTWPAGVRPVVHWSESPEDPNKMLKAHSEYIDGPINLYGLEGEVDVMIESKGKELALLEYRQYIIDGKSGTPGPRTVRAAAFAAAAEAAAEAEEGPAKKKKAVRGRGKKKVSDTESEEVEEEATTEDDE